MHRAKSEWQKGSKRLMDGLLYLEDGSVYRGKGFGYKTTSVGELVFNTSMSGYQAILTDPSYKGQIINMTYPLIGNYGVSEEDIESGKIHAFGFITRDISFRPSNKYSIMNINEWLEKEEIPAIYNIDTRSITKKIRTNGTIKCVISTEGINKDDAIKLLKETSLRADYMKDAGTSEIVHYEGNGPRVAVMDFGIKNNIVTGMLNRGLDVYLFPYSATKDEILKIKPDGLFLSNGPGNPVEATYAIEVAKQIAGTIPTFGMCMGHQILALALGCETYKMKFGHRGANHGVLDLNTDKVAITSQNHSYAVVPESVEGTGLVVTHTNLNDGTIEGLKHESLPIFSVQYHPEGSPAPNDSLHLMDNFVKMISDFNGKEEKNA